MANKAEAHVPDFLSSILDFLLLDKFYTSLDSITSSSANQSFNEHRPIKIKEHEMKKTIKYNTTHKMEKLKVLLVVSFFECLKDIILGRLAENLHNITKVAGR